MRYIDKNAKRAEGRNITDEYLDNECRTTDQVTGNIRYMNVDYSGSFTNKGYKNKLLELGMALQNKFCCYCLRKIGKKPRGCGFYCLRGRSPQLRSCALCCLPCSMSSRLCRASSLSLRFFSPFVCFSAGGAAF